MNETKYRISPCSKLLMKGVSAKRPKSCLYISFYFEDDLAPAFFRSFMYDTVVSGVSAWDPENKLVSSMWDVPTDA